MPSLTEIVSSFLTYGAQSGTRCSSHSDSASDISSEGNGGPYVPPHRRDPDQKEYSSASGSNISGKRLSKNELIVC